MVWDHTTTEINKSSFGISPKASNAIDMGLISTKLIWLGR